MKSLVDIYFPQAAVIRVVLDNLSTGHARAVLPGAKLVVGDLADPEILERTLSGGPWAAVFHFASLSLVGDSMREPLRYLQENVGNGRAVQAEARLARQIIGHHIRARDRWDV